MTELLSSVQDHVEKTYFAADVIRTRLI